MWKISGETVRHHAIAISIVKPCIYMGPNIGAFVDMFLSKDYMPKRSVMFTSSLFMAFNFFEDVIFRFSPFYKHTLCVVIFGDETRKDAWNSRIIIAK